MFSLKLNSLRLFLLDYVANVNVIMMVAATHLVRTQIIYKALAF